MTVTEFLEARIADDEAAARGALDGASDDGLWSTAEDWGGGSRRVHGKGIIIYDEGGHDEEQAAHIARWDPARVLAECAAKRAVIEAAESEPGSLSYLYPLAAVYKDHPDYRQEWAL